MSAHVIASGKKPTRPLIPEDANCVCHLWVNGGSLVDTKGNTWIEAGAVPRVAASQIFGGSIAFEGLGPFSLSDYFYSPSSDYLSVSSDFIMTWVFDDSSCVVSSWGDAVLLHHTPYPSSAGYWFGNQTNIPGHLWMYGAGFGATFSSDTPGVHVLSFGISGGSTRLAKWDNGTPAAPAGSGAPWQPTGVTAYLGNVGAVSSPWGGKLYEMYVTTTPASAGAMDAIHAAIMS